MSCRAMALGNSKRKHDFPVAHKLPLGRSLKSALFWITNLVLESRNVAPQQMIDNLHQKFDGVPKEDIFDFITKCFTYEQTTSELEGTYMSYAIKDQLELHNSGYDKEIVERLRIMRRYLQLSFEREINLTENLIEEEQYEQEFGLTEDQIRDAERIAAHRARN